jgi:PAS domain S-box-containing protein
MSNESESPPTVRADADIKRRLHELEARQLELEMQNAQLRGERDEGEAMLEKFTGWARAEDMMRISEMRYRRLFEAAHDGVLLLDPDTCRITDANPFMTQLLGYPREQLIGKELYEIGLLKDEGASREMFRMLKLKHQVRYEDLPLESQTGRHQEVEVVANLYQEGPQSVIQCNIRDITARRQVEEITRRNEALVSSLIEQAPVGVYVVDAIFRLQRANPVAMEVFKNIHPLLGRDFSEILREVWPPRIADQIVRRFRHTLRTGKPYQSTRFTGCRQHTGAKEVYEWQIQRVTLPAGECGVVCFFNDITERTKAETARRCLDVLTASNLKLKQEVLMRQEVERNLLATRQQQSLHLKQSRLQQKQLRDLSRGMLHAQEEERKSISRELHDVIAQTLVGINVHLAALIQGAAADPASIQEQISRTQLLVEKGVDIVHDFARGLRPTMLDDLGLIPALQTFMQGFMEETGIRVSLKAYARIEESSDTIRTTLYRIGQEALTNVARHANASRAEVSIETFGGVIRMAVRDNGKGFDPEAAANPKKTSRLGLLGMRERVEMIGGTFRVESAAGGPTAVHVRIPSRKRTRGPAIK